MRRYREANIIPLRQKPTRVILVVPVVIFLVLFSLIVWALSARAQNPPRGQEVLNQGLAARAINLSDTAKFTITRGIYIGDASACTAVLLFNNDTATVTMTSLQPGLVYPFSIVQAKSTGSTCASLFALY